MLLDEAKSPKERVDELRACEFFGVRIVLTPVNEALICIFQVNRFVIYFDVWQVNK